jgi:hypothetical protein
MKLCHFSVLCLVNVSFSFKFILNLMMLGIVCSWFDLLVTACYHLREGRKVCLLIFLLNLNIYRKVSTNQRNALYTQLSALLGYTFPFFKGEWGGSLIP